MTQHERSYGFMGLVRSDNLSWQQTTVLCPGSELMPCIGVLHHLVGVLLVTVTSSLNFVCDNADKAYQHSHNMLFGGQSFY